MAKAAKKTTDATAAIEPDGSRSLYIEWSLRRIRTAEIMADGGSFRMMGDLVDAILGDEAVMAALETRARSLLGADLDFESGQGRKKKAAAKAIEQGEDWWKQFPDDNLVELRRYSDTAGFCWAQIKWGVDEATGRNIGVIEPWHPKWFSWDGVARTWKVQVQGGTQIPIAAGDGQWMLYAPRGAHRPWISGAWRAIARWWLLKQYAIGDWGKYSDRHGAGTWVGATGINASKEDRIKLAQDLKAMAGNGSIALPMGFDLKLVESVANTWMTFQAQIDAADKGITVALTGLNVTNESGGSYAKAESLGGIRVDVIKGDRSGMASWAHDQHLVFWAELNFGDKRVAGWPWWAVDPPEDLAAKANTLNTLGMAIGVMKEVESRVDIIEILEDFDIPLLTEAEAAAIEAAKPEPPAPPPPPQNPPPPPPNGEQPPPAEGDKTPPAPAAKAFRKAVSLPASALAGQKYVDRVVASMGDEATAALRPDLKDLIDDVSAATSLDDVKARIKKRYSKMDPAKLQAVVRKAIVLTQLAGRFAVHGET